MQTKHTIFSSIKKRRGLHTDIGTKSRFLTIYTSLSYRVKGFRSGEALGKRLGYHKNGPVIRELIVIQNVSPNGYF